MRTLAYFLLSASVFWGCCNTAAAQNYHIEVSINKKNAGTGTPVTAIIIVSGQGIKKVSWKWFDTLLKGDNKIEILSAETDDPGKGLFSHRVVFTAVGACDTILKGLPVVLVREKGADTTVSASLHIKFAQSEHPSTIADIKPVSNENLGPKIIWPIAAIAGGIALVWGSAIIIVKKAGNLKPKRSPKNEVPEKIGLLEVHIQQGGLTSREIWQHIYLIIKDYFECMPGGVTPEVEESKPAQPGLNAGIDTGVPSIMSIFKIAERNRFSDNGENDTRFEIYLSELKKIMLKQNQT